CQSTSPCPALSASQAQSQQPLLSDNENSGKQSRYVRTDGRFLVRAGWSSKTVSLCGGASLAGDADSQGRLTKSKSISCLDNRLSIYKPPAQTKSSQDGQGVQEPKEKQGDPSPGEGLNGRPLSWSTLSLGPSSNQIHKRTLSLPRSVAGVPPTTIRKKISEWECRRVALPRMSLCLDKRGGERVGGSEGCPSLLSSPCSEKTFDFKGVRRMSTAFSECSYTETEEEEGVSDKDGVGRFQKRIGKSESSGTFVRSLSARKETSAVLNRIQKIEQALKENPSPSPPRYLSNCYAPDKTRQKSFMLADDLDSTCASKRSSICSVATEPDAVLVSDKLSKLRQRFSVSSVRSESPEPPSQQTPVGIPVNPLPKPKRTFEYDAKGDQKGVLSSNGLPPNRASESPPPLPLTPAPSMTRTVKSEGSTPARLQDRESCESEDATSLQSSYPSSPTENGTLTTGGRSRPNSKSTLEENAYEDIVEKENPYEDVDLKRKSLGRKSCLMESSRSWTTMDRKLNSPPQLPSKPSSQSLRLSGPSDRKSHRMSQLSKRYSHDEMLLGVSTSTCGLLDDSICSTGDTLASHRHWRIPKLVQRINSIYCTKRGKKRLKKLSMSNVETTSLRDDNSESESDSDDRFKAHTQRLLKLQSILRRAPSYRTLELQLIEWQERELFEYFVVVSLKKKPSKNSYSPEVTYQFPKLERPTKQMREAEQRLKAIPQFCFPDAKDWSPVSDYTSETFSFMLTGEDGSRRFGYCRRLLPTGKGPRLPEVYCVISRLGCFDLFSTILDEVERRRGVSAALVYPFMRSLMESPFPAPGKIIKVKTFLPGAGNEVIELRRPTDSRLEHVDFDSLFSCLSVRQVIRVFASLLLERRVIFVADKLSTLSSCMHAVVALLYPFSWQHTFIPVLPGSMLDIVCCPTPFLVGLLSSSLPKLKELPVEEALMVDLGTDRFIRQMDDEASLLPRKLQAALEQALEQRNDIINQDSDSESDEEYNSLNSLVSEAFIRFFLETIGHYSLFIAQNERGERVFQREAFRKSVASKSIRRFLGVFMESQMFAGFIQDRELRKTRAKGLFEQRVDQYLEELPDTEQSGVNKFLKGLGPGSYPCPLLMCHSHRQEPLELFCESCDLLCCSSCHLSSHKNHRVVQIGKALQDQQWLFESLMVQVEERRSAVENNAKQIEERLHGVKIAHRKAENQIKMAKMIMMNELNKRANLLIEQLEKISEDFQQRLEDQLQGAIEMCGQLDHVQKFITWATTHHCRGPVLFSRALISLQMQQLLESSLHSDPWSPVKIKFNWDASYWTKQISSLGQLSVEGGNCTYPQGLACSSILRPQPITCLALPPVCHRGREPGYGYQACCEPQVCCLHGISSQPDLSSLDKSQLEATLYNSSCVQPSLIAASLHQSQQLQRCWDPDSSSQCPPPSSPVPVVQLNCSQGSTSQPQAAASQPQSQMRPYLYHQHQREVPPDIQVDHSRPSKCQGKLSTSTILQLDLSRTAVDRDALTEGNWDERRRSEEARGQTAEAESRELLNEELQQSRREQSPVQQQQRNRPALMFRDHRDGRRSTSLEVSLTAHERASDVQSSGLTPSSACTRRKRRSQSIPAELALPSTSLYSERPTGCAPGLQAGAANKYANMDPRQRRASDGVLSSVKETSSVTAPSRDHRSPLLSYKTEPDHSFTYVNEEIDYEAKEKCRVPRNGHNRRTQEGPGFQWFAWSVSKYSCLNCPQHGRRQSDPLPASGAEKSETLLQQRTWHDAAPEGIAGVSETKRTTRSLTAPPYAECQGRNQSTTHSTATECDSQGRSSSCKSSTLPSANPKYVPQSYSALDLESDSDPRSVSEEDPVVSWAHPDTQLDSDASPDSEPIAESSSEAELECLAVEKSAAAGEMGLCGQSDIAGDSEPSLEYEADPESDAGAGSEDCQGLEADAESGDAETESDVQPDYDPGFQAGTDSDVMSDQPADSQGSVEFELDIESESELTTDDPQPLRSDLEEESHVGPGQRPLLIANPVAQRGAEEAQPDEDNVEMESEDFCAVCLIGGDLLCCDRCPKVFHLSCHVPPLLSFPSGDWVCSLCRDVVQPEVEYDCENERTCGEHTSAHGLAACDLRKCERLTLLILSNILSAPFQEPVSPLARHYYQIIKRPMDLSVIRAKLNKRNTRHYNSTDQFVADVCLMFRNCAKFNYPDSEVAQAGRSLEAFFASKLKEVFPDRVFPAAEADSDSDEYDETYKNTESGFPWPERREQCHRKRKRRHSLKSRRNHF
ncbi:hypothetical protein L3Q82_009060, partial [Scortum barcoo]